MNAAAGAKAHHAAGQAMRSGRLGAGALNPGSYASLGKTANRGTLYSVFSLASVKSEWWRYHNYFCFILALCLNMVLYLDHGSETCKLPHFHFSLLSS